MTTITVYSDLSHCPEVFVGPDFFVESVKGTVRFNQPVVDFCVNFGI